MNNIASIENKQMENKVGVKNEDKWSDCIERVRKVVCLAEKNEVIRSGEWLGMRILFIMFDRNEMMD